MAKKARKKTGKKSVTKKKASRGEIRPADSQNQEEIRQGVEDQTQAQGHRQTADSDAPERRQEEGPRTGDAADRRSPAAPARTDFQGVSCGDRHRPGDRAIARQNGTAGRLGNGIGRTSRDPCARRT